MNKRLAHLKAQIPINLFITASLTLAGAVAGSIIWVQSAVSSAIQPVAAQANQNTQDIANLNSQLSELNTKMDFVLGVYNREWNPQTHSVIYKNSN